MLTITIRKIALLGAIASLAAVAPAQAAHDDTDALVCNQATPHSLGGTFDATDMDPTPPARYTEDLKLHPGKGRGLARAASNSPALSLCGDLDGNGEGPGQAG